MADIERSASDEWTTMQAALAFGGFTDAAETERVTLWAAEEIESLRQQLEGAVEALREIASYEADEWDDRDYTLARMRGIAREALAAIGGR